MSGSEGCSGHSAGGDALPTSATEIVQKKKKAPVIPLSLIMSHVQESVVKAVKELLEKDRSLVNTRDYNNRTPLHMAAIRGWINLANCLLDYEADVNAQDQWKNTPLDDAEGAKRDDAKGAKRDAMIELLKSHGGLSNGKNGTHLEVKFVSPPLPKEDVWEIESSELDFSKSTTLGKGSFGEVLTASWKGTTVAVKRIRSDLSCKEDVIQDFKHEVHLLMKLRHPNIIQFLGAVTHKKPLMLVTEYMEGGDLGQYLNEKGALNPTTAINFAIAIARGMACLHTEPNVIIHRDLKPRNVLLVNTSADYLKVGDFGLSKLVTVKYSNDVYSMSGQTGSYRYMAPEVFRQRRYNNKVDIFSFGMILYQMLEGVPPMSDIETPYDAGKAVADGRRPTFTAKGIIPDLRTTFTAKGIIPDLRTLTEQCWSADPDKRPPFSDILKKLENIKKAL